MPQKAQPSNIKYKDVFVYISIYIYMYMNTQSHH